MSTPATYRSTYSSPWQSETSSTYCPPETPLVSKHNLEAVCEFWTKVLRSEETVIQESDIAESSVTLLIVKLDPGEPYRIIAPIHVELYFKGDDNWMAVFEESGIAFSASDPESARNELAKEILDVFEELKEMEVLGDLDDRSARRLAVLRRHILHK